jgi:endonuclease G
MVHPYWDMALFLADLPDEIEPLTISVESQANLLGRDVVVIGYPAFDPERNDAQVQQEIFKGIYNVKRIAPGRIVVRKRAIRSSWLQNAVDAMAHDSSTLGGNSGSAVLEVKYGRIAGLHFAGRYMVENYSVSGYELARDQRVVDAGVNFQMPLPQITNKLDEFWNSVDGESPAKPTPPPESDSGTRQDSGRKQDTGSATTNVAVKVTNDRSTRSQAVTVEIPLRISVSLGDASTDSQSAITARPPDGSHGDTPSGDTEAPGLGYNPNFLSKSVPTPSLSASQSEDAFKLAGSHLLHYMHFSVCQSKSRTLPRFVAWNIDGNAIKSVSRKGIPFIRDSRVPNEFQAGDELYGNNKYDRGHVARRADLTWGSLAEAKRANKDSFFFTNMTPQHESFNQSGKHGLWGELENAILEDVDVENLRVSVIGGPIFKENDPVHRGVRIPKDFWKLIAFRDSTDNQFKVAAYILTQSNLIPTEALELDPFKLYQVSLPKLAEETGLNFDPISPFDTQESTRESLEGSGVRIVNSRNDVL